MFIKTAEGAFIGRQQYSGCSRIDVGARQFRSALPVPLVPLCVLPSTRFFALRYRPPLHVDS
jgi:hypothetical protein